MQLPKGGEPGRKLGGGYLGFYSGRFLLEALVSESLLVLGPFLNRIAHSCILTTYIMSIDSLRIAENPKEGTPGVH